MEIAKCAKCQRFVDLEEAETVLTHKGAWDTYIQIEPDEHAYRCPNCDEVHDDFEYYSIEEVIEEYNTNMDELT